MGGASPANRASISTRTTCHSRSAITRMTSASSRPRVIRIIGVSMADIAVMSMCQTCTRTAVATMTTSAWVVRSAMATCADVLDPVPPTWPSRTTDIERLTTKFAIGISPTIKQRPGQLGCAHEEQQPVEHQGQRDQQTRHVTSG